jgi:nitrogen-specific signal transduction histidine kinase
MSSSDLLPPILVQMPGRAGTGVPGRVVVELLRSSAECLTLSVSDSGPGPAESVGRNLFEPFVSEKPDGVGLGLSGAREVFAQHGGRIEWHRADGMTRFSVELPCVTKEARHVDAISCR